MPVKLSFRTGPVICILYAPLLQGTSLTQFIVINVYKLSMACKHIRLMGRLRFAQLFKYHFVFTAAIFQLNMQKLISAMQNNHRFLIALVSTEQASPRMRRIYKGWLIAAVSRSKLLSTLFIMSLVTSMHSQQLPLIMLFFRFWPLPCYYMRHGGKESPVDEDHSLSSQRFKHASSFPFTNREGEEVTQQRGKKGHILLGMTLIWLNCSFGLMHT